MMPRTFVPRRAGVALLFVAVLAVWSVVACAQAELSEKDREILERGEYSDGQWVGGGIVAYFAGFGIGHAVQGRWSDIGWVFTVSELVCTGLLISDMDIFENSDLGPRGTAGLIGFVAFHVWEIVDAWVVPPRHNQRYRELKEKTGDVSIQLDRHGTDTNTVRLAIRASF
jgi:hypothetical protein